MKKRLRQQQRDEAILSSSSRSPTNFTPLRSKSSSSCMPSAKSHAKKEISFPPTSLSPISPLEKTQESFDQTSQSSRDESEADGSYTTSTLHLIETQRMALDELAPISESPPVSTAPHTVSLQTSKTLKRKAESPLPDPKRSRIYQYDPFLDLTPSSHVEDNGIDRSKERAAFFDLKIAGSLAREIGHSVRKESKPSRRAATKRATSARVRRLEHPSSYDSEQEKKQMMKVDSVETDSVRAFSEMAGDSVDEARGERVPESEDELHEALMPRDSKIIYIHRKPGVLIQNTFISSIECLARSHAAVV